MGRHYLNIKIVVVGDKRSGKTSLVSRIISGTFTYQYKPTVIDEYKTKVKYEAQNVEIELIDTSGEDDYKRLRCLFYEDTDVFLLCSDLAQPQKNYFKDGYTDWFEELSLWCPEAIIVLVGTKLDEHKKQHIQRNLYTSVCNELLCDMILHCDQECGSTQKETYKTSFQHKEKYSFHLREIMGCVAYIECSSATGEGIEGVLHTALRKFYKQEKKR